MKHIDKQLSAKILTLGPDYRNHRGGSGAVISVYSKYFEIFNFIPTYKEGSGLYKIVVFCMAFCKLLYVLIRNKKIRIVHIHGSVNASFYRKFICFVTAKYLFGKKVIYHIHSDAPDVFFNQSNAMRKKMFRGFIRTADMIVCLSSSWRQYFTDNFSPRKIEIVPNIIDYSIILKSDIQRDKIVFLFLGLIGDRKGIFDVIEVINQNRHAFADKMELIIGGNGETDKLQQLIEKYRIGKIIRFVGWVQQETKIRYLQDSDVYILPSYSEGLPVSVLEAMAYGKPVISTNVGGIPEIVKHKENGFLIQPGNLAEIHQSMQYFMDNPRDIEKYGAISAKIVEKHLPDSVVSQLEEIYNEML